MDLYTEAARIIKIIDNKRGSIKALVFASKYPNIRQLYALVCESLKYKKILESLIQKCDLHKDDNFHDKPLLLVLLYDHLLGKGLKNAGPIKKEILKHRDKIDAECYALLEEKKVDSLKELVSQDVIVKTASLPRYIRVNLINASVQEVIAVFHEEGWKQNLACKDISKLAEDEFMLDPFIPDVLIFPPGTELHNHDLYHQGSIVLQDRASCLPAHVLEAPENSVVIDCCAAPGNKTSHIASLMGNTGKVFAFDRDRMRLNTMKTQLVRAGVENAELFCKDFLSVRPDDPQFSAVEYILVDPSCSGSGIVTRLDYQTDSSTSVHRLTSLSNFQSSLLKHALRFPSVKRVVYSTCSIHCEENEKVIEDVIKQVSKTFILKKIFPEWAMRGSENYLHGDAMIRMCPEKHFTNGFFVACFERIMKGDDSTAVKEENVHVDDSVLKIENNNMGKKNRFGNKNKEHLVEKNKKQNSHHDNDAFCEPSRDKNCETVTAGSLKKKKKKEATLEENEDLLEECTSTKITDVSINKKKKKHKSGKEILVEDCSQSPICSEENSISKNKKAKKRKNESLLEDCSQSLTNTSSISKKQKGKNKDAKEILGESEDELNELVKKQNIKSKHYKESNLETSPDITSDVDVDSTVKKTKKKKKKHSKDKNRSESCTVLIESDNSPDSHFGKCRKVKKEKNVKVIEKVNNKSVDKKPATKKKRRHDKAQIDEDIVGGSSEEIFFETSQPKKKKKKHKH